MFIEAWPDLVFDPHGTNTKNDIKGEVHKLTDKTCPWLVPNGAPFVAGSVSIKTSDGQPIKEGWKECLKPMPLVEITGLDINTFLELDAEVLEQHDSIVIEYHSVGVAYVPRSDLEEQLYNIIHGADDIPWSKVIQVPDELPPSEHWHDVTEILGWDDVVMFCRYLLALVDRQTRTQQSIENIYANVRDVLDKLIAEYHIVDAKLSGHDRNYSNPHKITAFDLLLGNLDNYDTATVEQDIAGTRSDLFSTPAGAVQAVQSQTPDTSGLMKNGTLPISMLGSTDYLPPVIDGSFEGIGTDSNMCAWCLENNGRLMMIRRHYDGRTRALYFSYMDNYRDLTTEFYFTGFKYENALLKAAGYNLDTVLRGSGQGVLVVGDSQAGKWWVSLTNGTLNPNTHVFTELDVSGMNNIAFTPVNSPCTVTLTSSYIIFSCSDASNQSNGLSFYRLPRSSLGQGSAVKPTLFNVSYTDVSGRVKSNQSMFYPDEVVKDANGYATRYLFSFNPSVSIGFKFSDPVWFVEESADVLIMRYFLRPNMRYDRSGAVAAPYIVFSGAWRFNVASGSMALLDRTPDLTLDVRSSTIYTGDYQHNAFVGNTVGRDYNCSGVILPTGDFVCLANQDSVTSIPSYMDNAYMNKNTALEAIMVPWLTATPGNLGGSYKTKSVSVKTPLAEGPMALNPIWDKDGEFIPCFNQLGSQQVNIYRKVSGGYAERTGLTNLILGQLTGRPLTNQSYSSNVGFNFPGISLTGTAAELAAAGVECGHASFSGFQFRRINKTFSHLIQEVKGSQLILDNTFLAPRAHSKVYNEDTLTLTVNADNYYGLRAATLNSVMSLFSTDAQNSLYSCLRIIVPYQVRAETALANNLPCFAQCIWYSETDLSAVGIQLIALNFTQAAINSIKVVELNSPTLVRQGDATLHVGYQPNSRNMYLPSQGGSGRWPFYKDGNTFDVRLHTGVMVGVPGGAYAPSTNFVWNTSTNNFDSYQNVSTGYDRDSTPPLVPGLGYGTAYGKSYTGGASLIGKVANKNILLASVYPDSGWTIYFKAGTKLTINGTSYDAPIGTVDLRDIDPTPTNKTFYVYVTCYGDTAYYIVSGKRIRHNLSLIPAAKVMTNDKQILTIERYSTFMIGDAILSTSRKAGSIPVSIGMPMDEGNLSYVYQKDLTQ